MQPATCNLQLIHFMDDVVDRSLPILVGLAL